MPFCSVIKFATVITIKKINHVFERNRRNKNFGVRIVHSGGRLPNAKYGSNANAPAAKDTSENGHAGQRLLSFRSKRVRKTSGKIPSELNTVSTNGSIAAQLPTNTSDKTGSLLFPCPGAKKKAYVNSANQIMKKIILSPHFLFIIPYFKTTT